MLLLWGQFLCLHCRVCCAGAAYLPPYTSAPCPLRKWVIYDQDNVLILRQYIEAVGCYNDQFNPVALNTMALFLFLAPEDAAKKKKTLQKCFQCEFTRSVIIHARLRFRPVNVSRQRLACVLFCWLFLQWNTTRIPLNFWVYSGVCHHERCTRAVG